MGKENDSKKIAVILSKWITYLFVLFFSTLFAQKNASNDALFSKFRKEYKYTKEKKYKGPTDVYAEPAVMEDAYDDSEGYEEEYLEYSEEDIQKSRSERTQSTQKSYGDGTVPYERKIERPEPIEWSDEENEKEAASVKPFITDTFWIVLLVVGVVLLLAYIGFRIAKNRKPQVKLQSEFESSNQNPASIPKSELELRLENALLAEDYRECVRIYFTFILKELIRLRRIKWQKETTNYDYVLQMIGKPGCEQFNESVRMYDLVWYGEYLIGSAEFNVLEQHLKANYNALIAENE